MVRHQLKREQLHVVTLQTFRKNAFEGLEIGFLVENGGARIAAIQGMIQPACFIGSGGSWHPRDITASTIQSMSPDPFDLFRLYLCERFAVSVARDNASLEAKATG